MRPEVSVIIPAYNRDKSIIASLESLISQTYKNFEVIIIDDGSTDKTANIVKSYCDIEPRFKYFFQQNAGVSAARNKGLSFANGNYVCFLDSDDFFENDYLENMHKSIIKNNCNVCYCGYKIVSPKKTQIKKTKFKDGNVLKDYLLGRIRIHTTGWLIKKNFIIENNIKFTEGVSWGEDMEFFSEILSLTNKVCFVKEYLTNYTVYGEVEKLSSYSINKIDKDLEFIQRLMAKESIRKNKEIHNVILNYRLPALITNKLLKAFDYDTDIKVINEYYQKHKKIINNITLGNGLRGVYLNIDKIRLIYRINKHNGKTF